MRIAICAGEEAARQLCGWIDSCAGGGPAPAAEVFPRREDLLYAMKERPFDIVVVAQPGAIGMEAAVGARQFAPKASLIWASDEAAFIAQSYRLRAAMFLSLPLEEAQVKEALLRVGLA